MHRSRFSSNFCLLSLACVTGSGRSQLCRWCLCNEKLYYHFPSPGINWAASVGGAVPDPPCRNFMVEVDQPGLMQVGFICGFRSHTVVLLLLRWPQPGPLGAPSGWPSCLFPALHTSWHPGCPRLRLHFPRPSSEVSPFSSEPWLL